MVINRFLRSGVFSLLFVSIACNSSTNHATSAKPTTAPSVAQSARTVQLDADPAVVEDSKKTLTYLASDELEGRGVGLHGIDVAADYIADRFEKIGLKKLPGQSTYFQ